MILPAQETRFSHCRYCTVCEQHHGVFFVCSSYTLAERLDIELATIRAKQDTTTAMYLRLFEVYYE